MSQTHWNKCKEMLLLFFKRRDLLCWSFGCSCLKLLRQVGRVVIYDLFGKRELQRRISLAIDTGREIRNNPYPLGAVWHIKPPLDFTAVLYTVWWLGGTKVRAPAHWLNREPRLVLMVVAAPERFWKSFIHAAHVWRRLTGRTPTFVVLPEWVSTIQVKVLEPSDKA